MQGMPWTRRQLLVAFAIYCSMPSGRLHGVNPEIIRAAEAIGRSPAALAMKACNIASLDPKIIAIGKVGLKATAKADRQMWLEMESDPAAFAEECQQALAEFGIQEAKGYDQLPIDPTNYSGDDKLVITYARIGQSCFRNAVLTAYNNRCCITGLEIPSLLVAGHIIPWSKDKRNRLNPQNGLALTNIHEKAFDAGIITIDTDMTVKVAPNFTELDNSFFAKAFTQYQGAEILMPDKFQPEERFLAYHREHIFKG